METMTRQVEVRGIDELIPYVSNARTHSDEQIAQIAASIKEFGWTNPILIDSSKGIIAGHGRVLAARKLELKSVPCIVLDGLSEAQRKAYIIADNQLALNSGWNYEILQLELQNLKELDFNLDLLGINDVDLLGESGHLDDFFEDHEQNKDSKIKDTIEVTLKFNGDDFQRLSAYKEQNKVTFEQMLIGVIQ